jgi:hypothetical protein
MALTPAYPKDLPVEALVALVQVLRGQADPQLGVHAAWIITGFGLDKVYPPSGAVRTGMHVESIEAALLQHLGPLVDEHEKGLKITIPWDVILPLVLQWLIKILGL